LLPPKIIPYSAPTKQKNLIKPIRGFLALKNNNEK
jgi:hypothetical protein